MEEMESKLKELEDYLIGDDYIDSDIVMETLKEVRILAINYTQSCKKLKEFKNEFIEAWEDGNGGDNSLYRKAKSL